jgi:hypothetical protein
MNKQFSELEAKHIGESIGVDFNEFDIEQFRMGLSIELEHGSMWGDETNVTGDDTTITGKIVWAHLKEIPDYYTRLQKMEEEAGS